MADDPDCAKAAASQFRQIRRAMRAAVQPDWPAGWGEGELVQREDGSAVWRVGGRTYAVEGPLICEVDPVARQVRWIDPVEKTVKTLPLEGR